MRTMANKSLLPAPLALLAAGALCAQTAPNKPVIQGDLIDDTAPPAAVTNAASIPSPAAKPFPLAQPATATPASLTKDGALEVEFGQLAGFDFIIPNLPSTNQVPGADEADKQIPASVKVLNRKKVLITGYLMPLKEEAGKTTEFLIMRTQSACCYGIQPAINELIHAKAAGDGVPTIMDELVQIEGTLKVGAVREDGFIVGVYGMDNGAFVGKANR